MQGLNFNLGLFYSNCEGVAQDHDRAVLWKKKAAEQDDTDAQFNLRYPTSDYGRVIVWRQRAQQVRDMKLPSDSLKNAETSTSSTCRTGWFASVLRVYQYLELLFHYYSLFP